MDIETVVASVVSLLSFGALYKLNSNEEKANKKLKEYKEARLYFPSTLSKNFKNPEFYKNLPRSSENPNEYKLKAFVEGYVTCKNPIKGKLDGKQELVYSKVTKREIRSNDFLTYPEDDLNSYGKKSNVQAPLYFSLKDPNDSSSVLVHKNLDVKTEGALEKIAEVNTMKELNPLEDFFVQLGKVVGVLGVISRSLLFRGFHVGYNEVEQGITVGSALTVFGEVVYNASEGKLTIETPLAFLKDRMELIKQVKDYLFGNQVAIVLTSIPFLISTGYLVKRGYQYWKKKNERNLQV